MIHNFFMTGEIKRVQEVVPKDSKKNASAVLLVQYGKQRESSGGPVDFINAVLIRIPSYKYPVLKDKLVVGAKVEIHGHIQGVVKTIVNDGFFTTELVADRVNFEDVEDASAA